MEFAEEVIKFTFILKFNITLILEFVAFRFLAGIQHKKTS